MTSRGTAFLDLVRNLHAEKSRGRLGAVGTDVVPRDGCVAGVSRPDSYMKGNAHSTGLADAERIHRTQKEREWWGRKNTNENRSVPAVPGVPTYLSLTKQTIETFQEHTDIKYAVPVGPVVLAFFFDLMELMTERAAIAEFDDEMHQEGARTTATLDGIEHLGVYLKSQGWSAAKWECFRLEIFDLFRRWFGETA